MQTLIPIYVLEVIVFVFIFWNTQIYYLLFYLTSPWWQEISSKSTLCTGQKRSPLNIYTTIKNGNKDFEKCWVTRGVTSPCPGPSWIRLCHTKSKCWANYKLRYRRVGCTSLENAFAWVTAEDKRNGVISLVLCAPDILPGRSQLQFENEAEDKKPVPRSLLHDLLLSRPFFFFFVNSVKKIGLEHRSCPCVMQLGA